MSNQRSVYSIGASDGVIVGVIMGLCAASMIMSAAVPVLTLVGLALFISTPYVVWRMLRRAWLRAQVPRTFSAVWLHGICIFLFGSLIMALMMYLTLRFGQPGWIESQTLLAADRLAADPATARQAMVLHNIVDSGQLPSPIYSSISSIWLVSFTGSIWSMIFAFILTRVPSFARRYDRTV